MEKLEARITRFQHELIAFLDTTAELRDKRPAQACVGSPMESDVRTFGKANPFENAVTVSDLAFQYAHDHLALFTRAMLQFCDPFTSCTLIRSMLEIVAVGAWVVDPTIGTLERVGRVYSIRYESVFRQIEVLRCTKGISQSQLDQTTTRLVPRERIDLA